MKPPLYARLGVAEYFLFDPVGEILDPPFQGYRLEKGDYVSMPLEADGGPFLDEAQAQFLAGQTFWLGAGGGRRGAGGCTGGGSEAVAEQLQDRKR